MIKLTKLIFETHWYRKSKNEIMDAKKDITSKNMKMIMKYDERQSGVIIASFVNNKYILICRHDDKDSDYVYSIKFKKDEISKTYTWLVEFSNMEELNKEFGLNLNKKQIQKQVDKLQDKYFG